MLVRIEPHSPQPVDGARHLDDPNDWVRREIDAGLQRREVVVVPVFLDGALVPDTAELPEPIKEQAPRHAVAISGGDLAADIENLVRSIERGRQRATQAGGGLAATVPS